MISASISGEVEPERLKRTRYPDFSLNRLASAAVNDPLAGSIQVAPLSREIWNFTVPLPKLPETVIIPSPPFHIADALLPSAVKLCFSISFF